MTSSPDPALQEALDNIVQSSGPSAAKIQELFDLLAKSREQSKNPNADEDCPDPDTDCREILSPCCEATINIVFGSLPVKATCAECGKSHLLRDLVSSTS